MVGGWIGGGGVGGSKIKTELSPQLGLATEAELNIYQVRNF